jgi:uncharacterized protein YukE
MAAGDYVLYDYIGIEGIAVDLTTANSNATTLLGAGQAQRVSLAASWQGASQVTFDDAFNAFSTANTNIIDSTAAAIAALQAGNADMQAVELSFAAGF